MSFILIKFLLVFSNFLSASIFLDLNLTIPAASSKRALLSSFLPFKIASILPCPINEYPSFPIPVSIKRFTMSLSLQGVLFIKYSLSPDLKTLRVILTSLYSIGSSPVVLSNVKET